MRGRDFFRIAVFIFIFLAINRIVGDHISAVENLVVNHPSAVILDYYDLFFGRPDLFSDSDHLNVYGAEIFTDILVEDLTGAGLLPVSLEENR